MGLLLTTKCGRLRKGLIEKIGDRIVFGKGKEPDTSKIYIRFSEGVPVEVGCNEYDSRRCRLKDDICLYGSLKIEMQQPAPENVARG